MLKAIAEKTNINDLGDKVEKLERLKRQDASSGARFGSSLVNLGRLDGDKYQDFAVGAPHEDNGNGAVYIYRGSKSFWSVDGINGELYTIVYIDRYDDSVKLIIYKEYMYILLVILITFRLASKNYTINDKSNRAD